MARLLTINFSCDDPDRLATFWAETLGYEKEQTPPEILEALAAAGETEEFAAAIHDPRENGLRIFFERKKGGRVVDRHNLEVGCGCDLPGPFAPIHLDIEAIDREAEIQRLVDLGASVVEKRTQSIGDITESFVVMRDPEGNGFCLH